MPPHRFQKGQPPPAGSGRPKGSTSPLTLSLKEGILEAYKQAGGVGYLLQVAREDHKTFCALLSKLLPLSLQASVQPAQLSVSAMSDAELSAYIASNLPQASGPVIDITPVPALPEPVPFESIKVPRDVIRIDKASLEAAKKKGKKKLKPSGSKD